MTEMKGKNLIKSSVKMRMEHLAYDYIQDQMECIMRRIHFFLENDLFLNEPDLYDHL